MTIKPIVRFAPSPTGKLHVGNVRTALMNWLFAREAGGKIILRIDDTDMARSTKAFEDGLKEDLKWLGMEWDATFNQSGRIAIYDEAAARLKADGRLYPCYETSDDLDRARKLARAQSKPPIYNRAALDLTAADIAKLEAEGNAPHWRFKLSGKPSTWTDLVRGEQSIDTGSISDPVLIRADGTYLYTLPSVVDDIESKITHIIRGEDHVTNSGAQIEIIKALGGQTPIFAHTPLLVGGDGKSLSKRIGSLSMDELREQNIEPMAICSLLAKIGTSDPVEARPDMKTLEAEFSFNKIGRAPARFSEDELALVNGRWLHALPYADAAPRLKAFGIENGEGFWNLVSGNLEKFQDVAGWASMINGPMAGIIEAEDADFCKAAAASLPDKLTAESWGAWTAGLKASTGRKGKGLFMPLRMALTGRTRGPSMDAMLVQLGAKKAKVRLMGDAG
ncbi:MAG: glutamate--tRNA ligase [Robiginitomaculum sp.]